LGLINLFPFPGLDGGRLVFVFLEMITGRRVPEKIENYIHLAGFILLIALILFVTWKDILRVFQ
ncbi:MAG TPA: site-2 protease family protein, partial [Synergistales bacterium]|nr:site-2 protease family protein [Synergistales bacterium]